MENVYLTKKQVNRIKKNVKKEVFEKGRTYSVKDIEDMFDGADCPMEIVKKEISKQLKKDNYYNATDVKELKKVGTNSLEDNLLKSESGEVVGGNVGAIIKEDLKKIGKGLKQAIDYVIYTPLEGIFALPTSLKKNFSRETVNSKVPLAAVAFATAPLFSYIFLLANGNQKAIPYVLGTQLTTNVASGIYEYVKHVKNRTELAKA